MSDSDDAKNLPAQIADALVTIPKGLVPASIKALDRLIGASVEIPVAWLSQQKAKIEAQTQAYGLVEAAIANAAASEAGADTATVQRAVEVLVRKAYRKQTNRTAVAAEMVEELSGPIEKEAQDATTSPVTEVDEDWLNVFERYAEDASTQRMQKLWGRVLAGEIRRPGRFSARTLRFLSEFSQADALTFEEFSKLSFGDMSPTKLSKPSSGTDIRDLVYLESNGLIQGASGLGLTRTLKFNASGYAFVREGDLAICLRGKPNNSISDDVILLTPLGQELVGLLPGRDPRVAGKAVGLAMRKPEIEEAYLAAAPSPQGSLKLLEILWLKDAPLPPEQQ